MDRLEALRKANPDFPIYSADDPEFKAFGRVCMRDEKKMSELIKANIEMPAERSKYETAIDCIDKADVAQEYNNLFCGQLDEQWGMCWGHSNQMNGLEWHTCSEFNIGVTDFVLFLGKRGDCDADGRLDSHKVKAFYIPEGYVVEVYCDSMHLAPAEVDKNGFYAIVGLQRGTNEKIEENLPHDPMCVAKNKWIMFHEELPMPDGKIYGPNWKLNPIEA